LTIAERRKRRNIDKFVSNANKKGKRHNNPWIVIDSPVANQIFSGILVKDKSNIDAPGAAAPAPDGGGVLLLLFVEEGGGGLGGIDDADVRGAAVDPDVEPEVGAVFGVGEDSPAPGRQEMLRSTQG